MKKPSQPFRHFDMPVVHLDSSHHHQPLKAKRTDEIARRRAMNTGTLLAEKQERGILIAAEIARLTSRHEGDKFVAPLMAASVYNTAWYAYAQGAEGIMRRRIMLPQNDLRLSPITYFDFMNESAEELVLAGEAAHAIVTARRYGNDLRDTPKVLGTWLGFTAIKLANVGSVELLEKTDDPIDRQIITRQNGLYIAELSRELYRDIGSHPSLAQLADQDSDLSVYWRRNGSSEAVEALAQATEQPFIAPIAA
jgi:hypothetical protein